MPEYDIATMTQRITELEAFQTAVTVAIGAGQGGSCYEDVPKRIRALYAERDALKAESEGRLAVLTEKAEELRSEWKRAEKAEAQVETLTAERDELQQMYADAFEATELTTLRAALETLVSDIREATNDVGNYESVSRSQLEHWADQLATLWRDQEE